MKSIYSLTICARAILNMHSLNNEGTEGNQISTRMVNIVDQKGKLAAVNAVSGDMFKHIQAEHLFRLSKSGGLKLCAGCQRFSANRILDDPIFDASYERATPDSEMITTMIEMCTIDDIEGILVANRARNKSTPRKSIVEFGWVVGVPELTRTDTYFHVKYVPDSAQQPSAGEGVDNLGQSIFHRPASSGVYAVVVTVELSRLGFNDITQEYAIDHSERTKRYKALLESLLCTFVEPGGAMRSAQNPHIVNFEGVVSLSREVLPAPTISPLNDGYRDEITRIAKALNGIKPNAIECLEFDSLGAFAENMAKLRETTQPFEWQATTSKSGKPKK